MRWFYIYATSSPSYISFDMPDLVCKVFGIRVFPILSQELFCFGHEFFTQAAHNAGFVAREVPDARMFQRATPCARR